MIWLALLIPIVVTLILAYRYSRKMAWWEYTLPIAASVVMIAMCKGCSESIQTRDSEYWGGYVTSATYYEPWDEEVPCTHAKYRTEYYTVTDGKGASHTESRQVFDGYEHLYDVDNHPARWTCEDSNGARHNIDASTWGGFVIQFGNKTFRDMHRDYHSKDGDAYDTRWGGEMEKMQPVVTIHSYVNRVQASNSIYNYRPVSDKEKKGLFNYPDEGIFDTPSVLPPIYSGSEDIAKLNALLGGSKQVRVWILVFKDKDRSISKLQERYWKGGNKNELVICIGINGSKEVQWAEVFSWTKRADLKTHVRDYIQAQKTLDIKALAPWLTDEIKSNWERRHFKEFNYLTVEPPMGLVITVYILTLLISIGIAWYAVNNDSDADGKKPLRFPRY